MIRKIIILLFVLYKTNGLGFTLNIKYPETKKGYFIPNQETATKPTTYVLEGEDVIFELSKLPKGFDKCLITTPDADITTNLKPDVTDGKITYWNLNSNKNGCGVRIKNVSLEDTGRWKLQALNNAEKNQIQSFFLLKVLRQFEIPNKEISIAEGMPVEIDLTNLANYCEIANPLLETQSNLFDKCKVDLENVNKKYSGQWTVNAGVYGKIEEVTLKPNIHVFGENFNVGYVKHNSKISMYCNLNIVEPNTTFAFCRFIKTNSKTGFRLFDGLSNGDYSYYGHSLNVGECGITIEKPSKEDLTLWRCSLGYYKSNEFEIKESIINLFEGKHFSAINEKEILSSIGNPLTITCNSDSPLDYCIITHPNTTTYAVHNEFENGDWKTVSNLNVGECGLQIFNSTTNETGKWQCQTGKTATFEMDTISTMTVRIGTTPLVALTPTISTEIGDTITLKCISVAENNMLAYCRFQLPDQNGFKISEKVTKPTAIEKLYWYNGTSINEGDCQVTINKVQSNHIGRWTCAAKSLNADEMESYDYIEIKVPDDQLSTASISGIVVGCAGVLIITIGGTILYKRKMRARHSNVEVASHRSSEQQIFDRNFEAREPEMIQIDDINQGNVFELSQIRRTSGEATTSHQETAQL